MSETTLGECTNRITAQHQLAKEKTIERIARCSLIADGHDGLLTRHSGYSHDGL
ncbi:MAG: hypothetical protein Q8K61_06765 [Gallionella sp.]|nr:hypothetical protein [Gallionella sp.]